MATRSELIGAQQVTGGAASAPIAERQLPKLSKRRAVVELAGFVLLVETIMWLVPLAPNPRVAYASIAAVVALLLAASHIRDGLSGREIGLRFDNALPVLSRMAMPLLIVVLMMIVIGAEFNTLRFGKKFSSMLLVVPAWALLQQYMLLAFAGRRLRLILGDGRGSIVATASLFSLLHLPNPVLVIGCAAGGFIWAREYQREPNLLANALTHTIASAFLANSLPGWLLKNMVVGYNYFLR